MPKPYSLDLRIKVLQRVDALKNITKLSRLFNIDRRTIHRWIERKQINKLEAFRDNVKKPKKLNSNILEEYITENPDKTIQEIAQHFNVWYIIT